jgi:hypothetical protein
MLMPQSMDNDRTARFNFNKSICFTNVAVAFPDEADNRECEKE